MEVGQRGSWYEGVPGELLLDTCVVQEVFERWPHLFDAWQSSSPDDPALMPDRRALWKVMTYKGPACRKIISQATVGVMTRTEMSGAGRKLRWLAGGLEAHRFATPDLIRAGDGDFFRRYEPFELTDAIAAFEAELLKIKTFRMHLFERLLLVQGQTSCCDTLLTLEGSAIWTHREALRAVGFALEVVTAEQLWPRLEGWVEVFEEHDRIKRERKAKRGEP